MNGIPTPLTSRAPQHERRYRLLHRAVVNAGQRVPLHKVITFVAVHNESHPNSQLVVPTEDQPDYRQRMNVLEGLITAAWKEWY